MKTFPYSLVLQGLRKLDETEQILREMLSFDTCLIFDGLCLLKWLFQGHLDFIHIFFLLPVFCQRMDMSHIS